MLQPPFSETIRPPGDSIVRLSQVDPGGITRLSVVLLLAVVTCGCSTDQRGADDPAEVTVLKDNAVATAVTQSTGEATESSGFHYIASALSEEEIRYGWISLFDGATLFGWQVPENCNWRVENGTITADDGDISLLRTPFQFDDFELRCDFLLEKGGNSGIFLRTAEDASNPARDTYELNICDGHPEFPTGSLVGRHRAENVPASEGSWHTYHVVCAGAKITVRLDGKLLYEFEDTSEFVRRAGSIGLQKNKGRVSFRNIFLRPLSFRELFNGTDLTGFHPVEGSQSRFSVEDGAIHVVGGPGFLESDETFADFVLHVESRMSDRLATEAGRPANSGVFFRAQKGTREHPSNGYEMQIQYDFRDGDRTQPLDYGTGGIYRRQPARYVVGNNNEWVVQTLVAQGNRFATFVNGYQVLDWTDTRPPHENPRKGLRLEAGHISLQGHDPTTDLYYRAIRIHEFRTAQQ